MSNSPLMEAILIWKILIFEQNPGALHQSRCNADAHLPLGIIGGGRSNRMQHSAAQRK